MGLGLDWFPVDRVSIGGHAGVEALWAREENESSIGIEPPVHRASTVGTFSSGLRVHFYF